MFPYFLIKYNLNGESAATVVVGFNAKDVGIEFKNKEPDAEILDVIEYPDLQFFVVEPLKVEKGLHGYNVRQQFFNKGLIGVDVFESTYVFEYQPYPEKVIRLEDEFEITEIGKAIVHDIEQNEISSIVLEEIDESHLIDRLSAAIIKLHSTIAVTV
jgi:hypothetical protein